MTFNPATLLSVLTSHGESQGLFESVNGHEPKSAPGKGLSYSVFCDRIGPVPIGSGLASTSGVVTFMGRIYCAMLREPVDDIETDTLNAVHALLTAYSGDFEMGANVRCIDLLGQTGQALSARAGYLTIDNKVFRVMDITIPVIIDDLWEQAA